MAMNNLRSLRMFCVVLVLLSASFVSASQQSINQKDTTTTTAAATTSTMTIDETMLDVEANFLVKVMNMLWQPSGSGYQLTWPDMEFGWRIMVGTVIGFLGAAFGTVGGVGGGGIFVPMLSLIIGFDAKSATAISKCMITGGAGATVFYNLKQKHPTLVDLPLIDYDLALLFQPVLVLGISIAISTKAMLKGVETWKKETILKKEVDRLSQLNGTEGTEDSHYQLLPRGPINGINTPPMKSNGSILKNIRWKALGLLFSVWISILVLEIAKSHTTTCSVEYWMFNLLQIPVALGVTSFQAVLLYKGKRVIASKGDQLTHWRLHQLILYCACGIVAGMVGGLLGLGGGFILGPLFLELGIPPQVSSATATFAMTFSASMSVVEYYLLKRFPISYTLYFVAVSTVAAFIGQYVVKKLISLLGRASIIIFILAGTVFVSALSLGKKCWHSKNGGKDCKA
ncbi:hypothetical protein PIB30_012299 [Stylosanthes scabra]|uniref:Sulfite exporter TauE/SafE family protein n=1 Tax=Stylosanthes scabra TaxID=79078 RepID=A0ABU6Y480_9FABA|nr:hypothetical protein [Stylosanthes scabra]